ncbi:hypothetical protein P8452_01552 [Trifolium repens]|nr:hypothetical protein P8452_01552 [Trifolium repens]
MSVLVLLTKKQMEARIPTFSTWTNSIIAVLHKIEGGSNLNYQLTSRRHYKPDLLVKYEFNISKCSL